MKGEPVHGLIAGVVERADADVPHMIALTRIDGAPAVGELQLVERHAHNVIERVAQMRSEGGRRVHAVQSVESRVNIHELGYATCIWGMMLAKRRGTTRPRG